MIIVWESTVYTTGTIFMIIVCIIIMMISVLGIKNCNEFKKPKLCKTICIIIIFVLALANVHIIMSRKLEYDMALNNSKTIEGTIENFYTAQNGVESFCIGDEFFKYPLEDTFIGYSYPKREWWTSVINGEGQYVKLTYYKTRNNNNAILKIEILQGRQGDGSPVS